MVKLLPQAMFTSCMISEKIKFTLHHNVCLVSSTDQKCDEYGVQYMTTNVHCSRCTTGKL